MIHHLSIPARHPRRVAEVLAELMGGKCYPFVQHEGAFLAASGDNHGTMIEVLPEGVGLALPEDGGPAKHAENQSVPRSWPFHLLLSVTLDQENIERIGAREGWRTKLFGRGRPGQKPFFHVIEFWLENRLMVEVVTASMAREYEEFLTISRLDAMNERFQHRAPASAAE